MRQRRQAGYASFLNKGVGALQSGDGGGVLARCGRCARVVVGATGDLCVGNLHWFQLCAKLGMHRPRDAAGQGITVAKLSGRVRIGREAPAYDRLGEVVRGGIVPNYAVSIVVVLLLLEFCWPGVWDRRVQHPSKRAT